MVVKYLAANHTKSRSGDRSIHIAHPLSPATGDPVVRIIPIHARCTTTHRQARTEQQLLIRSAPMLTLDMSGRERETSCATLAGLASTNSPTRRHPCVHMGNDWRKEGMRHTKIRLRRARKPRHDTDLVGLLRVNRSPIAKAFLLRPTAVLWRNVASFAQLAALFGDAHAALPILLAVVVKGAGLAACAQEVRAVLFDARCALAWVGLGLVAAAVCVQQVIAQPARKRRRWHWRRRQVHRAVGARRIQREQLVERARPGVTLGQKTRDWTQRGILVAA